MDGASADKCMPLTMLQVPPMVVGLIKAAALLQKHDLCCVEQVTVAASNLTREVADAFRKLMPNSTFVQGYGLTEAAVGVSFQNRADLMAGSCGSLFPLFEVRLVDAKGDDVVAYDAPGELWLKSPSIMLGYLDNEQATANAFCDGWLRTGDLMQVRLSDKGYEHFFIVDRVKELIKVRVSIPLVAGCANSSGPASVACGSRVAARRAPGRGGRGGRAYPQRCGGRAARCLCGQVTGG